MKSIFVRLFKKLNNVKSFTLLNTSTLNLDHKIYIIYLISKGNDPCPANSWMPNYYITRLKNFNPIKKINYLINVLRSCFDH